MSFLYSLLRPLLFTLSPETAHTLSIRALKSGLLPGVSQVADPILESKLFGLTFTNPIGLSAGYDKNAEAINGLEKLGFGFLEVGSVTPKPQPGNPQPRIFRLPEDRAVINRLGFNNGGLEVMAANLTARTHDHVVGANLGANKDSEDRVQDYVIGMHRLAPLVDYVTVNISSPNTPGLRTLHGREELTDLLGRLSEARKEMLAAGAENFPILLKIAPDLTDEDKADIASTVQEFAIDGIIIGNTTITRPEHVKHANKTEAGGLSGAPLKALSLSVLKDMYRATGGQVPLIGVGGIETAEDAYERIRAGASLLQIYTAMIYHGPYLAHDIALGLAERLRADDYANVSEAVGVDVLIER
ncbi:MAG: quinone-dependent dihydroorotate dehydrogenase [Proteobacteria bacterium]|nr:quinone-dependent dihydroorotate dehydrogenase [Pseudomonadota bacterium]